MLHLIEFPLLLRNNVHRTKSHYIALIEVEGKKRLFFFSVEICFNVYCMFFLVLKATPFPFSQSSCPLTMVMVDNREAIEVSQPLSATPA